MKKTATILLLSVLLFSCSSDSTDSENMSSEDLKDISADCNCSEVDFKRDVFGDSELDKERQKRESGVYKKDLLGYQKSLNKPTPLKYRNGEIFTGTCEEKWGDESRKKIQQYSQGKLHGKLVQWDEQGNLRLQLNFKDGKQDGKQLSWHANGQQNSLLNFKNGIKHGLEQTWNDQGKLIYECERKDGDIIESGFEYEDDKFKEAWFNLPNKEVKVAVGHNSVKGSSYEFYAQNTIFGPENDYEIGLNDKLSDKQILSYTEELLTTHFSKFDVILLGTRTSSSTGEEIVSIHPNYLSNGQKKITEIERITNLLLDNFSKIKIDGKQSVTSNISNPSADEENIIRDNTVVSLYKISDPDGYSNLRDAPKGKVIQKVYETEAFEVIGQDGDYREVKLSDGTTGFIHKSRVIKK